jgi:hypothetical protein
MAAGLAKLSYESSRGYLRSLLKEMDIPISSQSLVFSKTSFQHTKIGRTRPRAVYFRDDAYVDAVLTSEAANLAASQSNLVKAQQDYERLKPLVEQDAAAKLLRELGAKR